MPTRLRRTASARSDAAPTRAHFLDGMTPTHAQDVLDDCEDPMLLSRLRQTIFTSGAYRVAATTKARREANGSRHGEMPPDRTGHPHRFDLGSQEFRGHAGLFRTGPLPNLSDRA